MDQEHRPGGPPDRKWRKTMTMTMTRWRGLHGCALISAARAAAKRTGYSVVIPSGDERAMRIAPNGDYSIGVSGQFEFCRSVPDGHGTWCDPWQPTPRA